MKYLIIAAFAVCIIAAPVPFKTCGSGSATLHSLDATPFPPVAGQKLTLTATGTVASEVTKANAHVTVSLNGASLVEKDVDLCALSGSIKCPIAAGPLTVSESVDLPSFIPSGSYDVKVSAVDQNGALLFCYTVSLALGNNNVVSPLPSNEMNAAVPFKTCGVGSATLHALDASPFPPVAGQKLTLTATGTVASEVTKANAHVTVSLNGASLVEKDVDLCSLSSSIKCPIAAGPLTVSESVDLPSFIPSGSYDVKVSAVDQNGALLFCYTVSLALGNNNVVVPLPSNEMNAAVPFKTCGVGSATVNSLDATPFPPVAGQKLTLTASGSVNTEITKANAHVTVSLNGASVIEKDIDLCAVSSTVKCPVSPGPLTVTDSIDVPSFIPSGSYDVKVNAVDQNGALIFCHTVSLSLSNELTAPVQIPFTSCANGDLNVTSVSIEPFPPVAGKPVEIIAAGTLASDITGGSYDLQAILGGIPLLKQNGDLCQFAENLSCPVKSGSIVIKKSLDVPSIAPAGSYEIRISGQQQDSKDLFCVDTKVDITRALA